MVIADGVRIEIATARQESYSEDSRKPDVRPASLKQDALRRDFTVNTLLYDPWAEDTESRVVDLLGLGLSDLKARVLRTPQPPDQTFIDDPLRMLRAVRLKNKLGFQFADGLEDSIKRNAPRLRILSAERVQEEFVKMLALQDPAAPIEDLDQLGLLAEFAPEISALRGVEQGEFHYADVFDHTIAALRNVKSSDLAVRLAILLHDIGKPATRTVEENGRVRFFGHERLGEEMAEQILLRLRFGSKTIERVKLLVRNHMRLTSFGKDYTDAAVRRLVRDLGPETENLLTLIEADKSAMKRDAGTTDVQGVRDRISAILKEVPAESLRSPLSGDEVIEELGLEQGPQVGEALRILEEAVLDGALSHDDKSGAIKMLKERFFRADS